MSSAGGGSGAVRPGLGGDAKRGSAEEPPADSLGCTPAHHEAVLWMRSVRDHTAFVVFFIGAILFSGTLVRGHAQGAAGDMPQHMKRAPRRWASPSTTASRHSQAC